jgi:hypothetical protein
MSVGRRSTAPPSPSTGAGIAVNNVPERRKHMMYRRVVLIGLLGIGVVTMWAAAASAHSAGYRLKADGTLFHASSVDCHFEAVGTGSTPTTGTCEVIEGTSAILFCLNPANHQVNGKSTGQFFEFKEAVGAGVGTKKGKTRYDVVAEAIGLASSDAECNQDPNCLALREFCINSNWVPFDVVPIDMTAEVKVFACLAPPLNPETPCCDPTMVDGGCIDHDASSPSIIDPEATLRYSCLLPNPNGFELGDFVRYNCTLQP